MNIIVQADNSLICYTCNMVGFSFWHQDQDITKITMSYEITFSLWTELSRWLPRNLSQ